MRDPVWLCSSALSCLALPFSTLPGAAWPGPVLPIPIQSCRTPSGPSGPAWHCSALSGLAQSCLTRSGPVWPFSAQPVPTDVALYLFNPARPCASLSGAALIYPVRSRLFVTIRPCLVCINYFKYHFLVEKELREFKSYSSGQQSENKKQWR